jgi:hypothetical protein
MAAQATVVLVGILVNAVWLAFLSDILSKTLFRTDLPLARALKCVGVAYAINWAIVYVLIMALPLSVALLRFDWQGLAVGFTAAVLVFLWEWRSFHRHWSPDEDLVETFE